MVIKVLCFSIMSISSIAGCVQASEFFHNNKTNSNLPTWLPVAIVNVILH